MKTMRKQARAAREARERSRERRSGGVWVEHDAIRTPRDATCITCGTPESLARLERSGDGCSRWA